MPVPGLKRKGEVKLTMKTAITTTYDLLRFPLKRTWIEALDSMKRSYSSSRLEYVRVRQKEKIKAVEYLAIMGSSRTIEGLKPLLNDLLLVPLSGCVLLVFFRVENSL